jgi:antitoxin (DNA-binding transcriptional repressor) of toxin-antitoxin stability system
MRMLSIQEFEQDPQACLAEAEAGERLVLLRGGKPVVELIPHSETESSESTTVIPSVDRAAAIRQLKRLLEQGLPLGGIPPTRDEMHDGR